MPATISSVQTIKATQPRAISDDKEELDKEKSGTAVDQFPEGGTAAWCTVLGATLVQSCCFGYITSFGVYQDYYTLHYLTNESPSTISWIGGVNAFMVTSTSIIAGIFFDRGYFYHLMIGGSLLESFTLFMLSLTQPGHYYQILLAQGIGLGIAQGLLYIPTMAIVSHYFYERRTLAMSLVACGSSLGSIVHPIMLNYLFNRSVGFANGVRISAGLVSALLVVSCPLMRARLEPPKRSPNYVSVGRGIIRDAPFCVMSIALLLVHIGFYYPVFYLQLDSVKHGDPETFSFYSLVLLNGGSLIGRLSAGFIEPYVGVPGLMIIATTGMGILTLGMIGLDGVASVVVLGTIWGYFSGLYIAMLTPLMALLTSNFSELGARMGIGLMIIGVGDLIGGPVAGALLTSQYKWWQSSLSIGFIALAGTSSLVVMQLMLIRRRTRSNERQEA